MNVEIFDVIYHLLLQNIKQNEKSACKGTMPQAEIIEDSSEKYKNDLNFFEKKFISGWLSDCRKC